MSLSLAAVTTRILVDPLLAAVFPSHCVDCGDSLDRPTQGPLCDRCWELLPRHRGRLCPCGLPLFSAGGPCGRCRRGFTPFESGASIGPYQGALRTLIHELKYRGRRRVAGRLAEILMSEPAVSALLTPGVTLACVPLHPRRRRERGFNQSELLAAELARRAGLEMVSGALVRRKDTPPQTGLTAAQRRRNMAGAFVVRRRSQVAGRTVIVVDDVFTTGATVRACVGALREAGAARVRILTVARVV